MSDIKIVLVAPYLELLEVAENVKKDLNLDIIVEVGDLSEGVKIAKKWEQKGAGVIISRGGTYKMIKEAVTIPVVEIKVSPYDILRQFQGLVGFNGTIGVAGYKNVIYGCEVIGEILGLNLIKVIIEKEEQGPFQVATAAAEHDVSLFIGDTIGARSAKSIGLKSRLITSGKESVANAMNEAVKLLEAIKVERAKTEQIKIIVDFVHDGIIAVDKTGRISMFNKMAEKIFKRSASEAINQKVEKIIPNTRLYEVISTGKSQLGELQSVSDIMIVTNRVPIIVNGEVLGAVATFQDITFLQKTEYKIRRKLADRGFLAVHKFEDIVCKSRKMMDVINHARKYAQLDSTVLIVGETGTGKELFAQSIHNASKRAKGPFVAINCAALPENLLESELFGYEEGAFTGARKGGKPGLFELAHMGTIFLDEVGEMPLRLQAKLLRVIQERTVMRIGDDKVIPIDIRIICATNKNLLEMIRKGSFREDLYYRINILKLDLPPLRERKEDLDALVGYFIKKFALKIGKEIKGISHEAMDKLRVLEFYGNVRELENIIERACAVCEEVIIQLNDIKLYHIEQDDRILYNKHEHKKKSLDIKTLDELEREYIKKAIEYANGNISEAARKLGIHRSTLWRKIKYYRNE